MAARLSNFPARRARKGRPLRALRANRSAFMHHLCFATTVVLGAKSGLDETQRKYLVDFQTGGGAAWAASTRACPVTISSAICCTTAGRGALSRRACPWTGPRRVPARRAPALARRAGGLAVLSAARD